MARAGIVHDVAVAASLAAMSGAPAAQGFPRADAMATLVHANLVGLQFSATVATPITPEQSLSALIEGQARSFASIDAKFVALAGVWKRHNAGSSVIDYHHAAYIQIIGMGMGIVPRLLREVEAGDTDWVLALKYITGEKVTTPEMRGHRAAIRDAWLQWGWQHGVGSKLRA